jgi:hypothetical protein
MNTDIQATKTDDMESSMQDDLTHLKSIQTELEMIRKNLSHSIPEQQKDILHQRLQELLEQSHATMYHLMIFREKDLEEALTESWIQSAREQDAKETEFHWDSLQNAFAFLLRQASAQGESVEGAVENPMMFTITAKDREGRTTTVTFSNRNECQIPEDPHKEE